MSNSPKIIKRKLSDEVFDRLYAMIENGDYKPGDCMPSERELMESFGVGRPAIREAMQSLERMGLIIISHGQLPRVALPTAIELISQIDLTARYMLSSSQQPLEHLKEARVFFEVGMVRQAAKMMRPEDITRLRALLEVQRSHLAKDSQAFVQADMAFHTAIAAMTRNPIFEATSQAMLGWLARFHVRMLHWEGNEQITMDEHDQIIRSIEAKDPDQAETAMIEHLKRAKADYQNHKSESL